MSPWLRAVAAAALFWCGCENPSVTTEKAGSASTQGVITAKGSVWVNGVEYQTSASRVSVDGTVSGEDDLKVGMYVSLRAAFDPVTAQWNAGAVDYESRLRGPVTSVDASSFGLLGATVDVDGATVFEGVPGLDGLEAGTSFVEVSGVSVDQGPIEHILATRVEVKDSSSGIKLTGRVTGLSTGRTGGSFVLTDGDVLAFQVRFSGALDQAVSEGGLVRAELAPDDICVETRTIRTSGTVFRPAGGSEAPAAPLPRGWEGSDLSTLKGRVTGVNLTNGTLKVTPSYGAALVLQTGPETIYHSSAWVGASPLSKVLVGTPVEVRYWTDRTGGAPVFQAVKLESDADGWTEGHFHR